MRLREWAIRVAIAIDQLGNVLIKGGMEDETISSRCARHVYQIGGARRKVCWTVLGWILEKLDPGHLIRALQHEQEHAHLPAELR